MKWRKGLACSSPLNQDYSSRQVLKGEVYNIFPYIRDPNPEKLDFPMDRAFTLLGIINAMFFPYTHQDELARRPGLFAHELAHFILGIAMITCEERVLAANLLGSVWDILINFDDDVRLLIPSFTVVGAAGKAFELQKLADQLVKLYEAREAVHEIVARTIQIGEIDWDRNKAKGLIREFVADHLLVDEKALDGFLDVYENLGPMAAYTVGHYALNAGGLTQKLALARFQYAAAIARSFKPKKRRDTAGARLRGYRQFVQHLDNNLPYYNMTRCPVATNCAGDCLSSKLHSWADSMVNELKVERDQVPNNLGECVAAMVLRYHAHYMGRSRCNHEEQHARGNEVLPASMQEILDWYDPEALSLLTNEKREPTSREVNEVTMLALVEHENIDYKYTIGITRGEKDTPLSEIAPKMFWRFMIESQLQQMMCGEGPLCLCYPHRPSNCPFRPFLHWLWYRTEPDPEWQNNWKQPNKKPLCIE